MSAASTLQISIDLGCETLKMAYAYQSVKGSLCSGHIVTDDGSTYPAMASYNAELSKWVIGDNLETYPEFCYDTLVRIKDLVSMIIPIKTGKKTIDNSDYYKKHKNFSKFYFPQKRKLDPDFSTSVSKGETFESTITPKELCQLFFKRVFEDCITPFAVKTLQENPHLTDINIISLYPLKATREYVSELEGLIKNSLSDIKSGILVKNFKITVNSMSSPKAVAVGAYHRGLLNSKDPILLADIGERDISVTKISVIGSKSDVSINVDGVTGHNAPEEIGGEDFDEAISEIINEKLGNREVLGLGRGGMNEHGTYRQQFLLMRHIKSLKACFSIDEADYNDIFADGVPIYVQRDVAVKVRITKEDFIAKLFEGPNSIGNKIAAYLDTEMQRPVNKRVKTLLLTGGTASCFYIAKYLSEKLGKKYGLVVKALETKEGELLTGEYAPAIGAAIVEPANIVIKLRSTLTYGTWVSGKLPSGVSCKKFHVLLNSGDEIPEEGCVKKGIFNTTQCIIDDEFYSYPDPITDAKPLFVGDPGSPERRAATKKGLKVVSGSGGKGHIVLMKKDKFGKLKRFDEISLIGASFYFYEGFKIDPDGRMTPFAENAKDSNSKVVQYRDVIVDLPGLEAWSLD